MGLTETDDILIPLEALEYIEYREKLSKSGLMKFEIIELFFEWLNRQEDEYQIEFLRNALKQ